MSKIRPYEDLANAIIERAYEDLVWTLSPTAPGKDSDRERAKKKKMRKELDEFFYGDWFSDLTSLPAEIIYKRAYLRKAVLRERNWLKKVEKAKRIRERKTRRIAWDWRKADKIITDHRHAEWIERKKWRKERLHDTNIISEDE